MAVASLKRQRRRYKGSRVKREIDADLIWERPSDWPQLPEVLASQHKFAGLYKIEDHDMNHVAMVFTQGSGTYHVDWGDGTSGDFASGGAANHTYTYSDAALGNATSEGFKVAIITVTPNGGLTFTAISINQKPTPFGSNNNASSGWLDVRMSLPSVTLASNFGVANSTTIVHRNLRQFEYIGDSALTSGLNAFSGLVGLESLKVPKTFSANMASMSGFLNGCVKLKYCPDLDTHASNNFASMFASCSSLRRVPVLDTSAGTVFQFMFSTCSQLEDVPLFDTHLGTTFASMFASCIRLQTVPLYDLSAGLTLSSMFAGCTILRRLPTFNTSAATAVNLMFSGASNLAIIPALDFSAVNSGGNIANVFNLCTSMVKNLSFGAKFTHALPGQMSSADLDVYYTNLGTASAQTLTVTGNVVATDTPSIATAKGWTVTGT